MEKEILNLLRSLPNYDDFKHLIIDQDEAHYILSMASENIKQILEENKAEVDLSTVDIEESSFLIEALTHKFWELIHTGIFSKVPLETRKIYTLSCLYKVTIFIDLGSIKYQFMQIAFSLISSYDQKELEICSKYLDEALLIGYSEDISVKFNLFKEELMKFLDEKIDSPKRIKLPYIDPIEHRDLLCDIPILHSPTVETFRDNHFIPLKPTLLRGVIDDWPALTKWRDLSYILKVAGNRTVPIEIGSNYTTDDWSQQLIKIRDFLNRQFGTRNSNDGIEIEYLAQHELFDHVPALKEDINYPQYCSLGAKPDKIDIKAWLGPKGTISPLHQDPKHNILCQVFGTKRIILASPEDTHFLYPHEAEFFHNTSQINAENLDFHNFPLCKNVKFYHLTLQEGECLYLPPKWWHYVRAETKSFSVSFWWE